MKQLYLIMTASALLTAASGRAQDKRLVGLREEMEFVDTYVELHRVRLGDCLTVAWQVDEAVREDAQLLRSPCRCWWRTS